MGHLLFTGKDQPRHEQREGNRRISQGKVILAILLLIQAVFLPCMRKAGRWRDIWEYHLVIGLSFQGWTGSRDVKLTLDSPQSGCMVVIESCEVC